MPLQILRSRYAFVLSERTFLRSMLLGIPLLVFGLSSPLLMKRYLMAVTAGVAEGPDLLLDRLPSIDTFGIAVWGPLLLAVVLTCHLLWKPWYIPIVIKSIGVLFVLRGFFIILTPFGQRSDQYIKTAEAFWHSISYYGNDYFFSGHTAFPFLLALVFWDSPRARYFYLFSSIIMGAAVLLEHIHYSIDVFAAPFIVYGVWKLCTTYFRGDMDLIASAHAQGITSKKVGRAFSVDTSSFIAASPKRS